MKGCCVSLACASSECLPLQIYTHTSCIYSPCKSHHGGQSHLLITKVTWLLPPLPGYLMIEISHSLNHTFWFTILCFTSAVSHPLYQSPSTSSVSNPLYHTLCFLCILTQLFVSQLLYHNLHITPVAPHPLYQTLCITPSVSVVTYPCPNIQLINTLSFSVHPR